MLEIIRWFKKLLVSLSYSITNKTKSKKLNLPKIDKSIAQKYVSVVIPALNEAKHIADVVSFALADPVTAEVIVIDDSSIDDTVEKAKNAGALVYTSSMLGKGASMCDGIQYAKSNIIVYLDGDLTKLQAGIISSLVKPIQNNNVDFVKARFGRSGGRVTELTAKPMIKIFFPELAHIVQPLGGIIAANKNLLKALTFEDGYGVDIALLIDALMLGAKIEEVDIGSIEHDSQPLNDLTLMANEIAQVIHSRAKSAARLHIEQITAMYELQRQASSEIEYIMTKRKDRQSLLLLDMDGTIISSRYAVELAKQTGLEDELNQLLDDQDSDTITRSESIANIFKYVHKVKFQQVAKNLIIRPGVIEFVNLMRRNGFMVGVVSDSYFVAAEIIRRRIFADFALAHTLIFDNEICTGKIRINHAFLDENSNPNYICKSNILRYFINNSYPIKIQATWVIGDNLNDLAMMRLADRAFVIDPKSDELKKEQSFTQINSFEELIILSHNYHSLNDNILT